MLARVTKPRLKMFFMMELSDLPNLTHILHMTTHALHLTVPRTIPGQFLAYYGHVFFGRPTNLGIATNGFGQLVL